MKRNSSLFMSRLLTIGVCLMSAGSQFGCASLQRSAASGYAYRDSDPNLSQDRRYEQRAELARELGFSSPEDIDGDEAEALDRRLALRKMENQIEGREEREQYFKNKPYMRNDRERMAFLGLDSFEARAGWLNRKGIGGPTVSHPPAIQALVDINDITTGMTKQAVRDSWGEPELVEVSGNPMYGNERWHYTEQTSSTEGYHTQRRMVYFEAGRVIGWESR